MNPHPRHHATPSSQRDPISSNDLGVESIAAYLDLLMRLGICVLTYPPLCHWLVETREHRKALLQVLQASIEVLPLRNQALQQEMRAIALLTLDRHQRDTLFLTHLENYCCQRLGDRPRLIFLLRDFLAESPCITPIQQDLLQILSL